MTGLTSAQKVLAYDAMAAHVTILDQENTELRARVQALLNELDLHGVVYEHTGVVEALRSVFEDAGGDDRGHSPR